MRKALAAMPKVLLTRQTALTNEMAIDYRAVKRDLYEIIMEKGLKIMKRQKNSSRRIGFKVVDNKLGVLYICVCVFKITKLIMN